MGLLYTGSKLFPIAWVTGYRRVPDPPARMIPLYRVLSVMIYRYCELGRINWNSASPSTVDSFRWSRSEATPHFQDTSEPFCESHFQMSPSVSIPARVRSYARPSHSGDRVRAGPSQK